MEEMIIDASEQVVGRLASKAAKEALKGNKIVIVNADKAIISGTPKYTEKIFHEKLKKGDPYHGPFYPKTPEGVMKRIIRGMLPYKKPLGKKALKRVRVYREMPEEFKDRELKDFGAENKLRCKYITLSKLCERMGGK
ncbi:MAG: 50S ribosomal protein L13 [Nanoarchaeota archaeon]|nr:50S ribosomal protein L13 [Nanoarchaeota archaeon]MBU2520145.1 50S ribosomal protein L13 [Nanoarchaeota archaeon]